MPRSDRSHLSIVIPIYRNAETLEALVGRLHAALRGYSDRYELLFVVDASPDESLEVLEKLSEEDASIRVIGLEVNRGQHAALLLGLSSADSDFIAVMDGDLQDPPEVLPDMLAAAERTGGSAYGYRKGRYQSFLRMASSRVFKGILYAIAGLPPRIGTFFVVPAGVVAKMLSLRCAHPQIVVMAGVSSENWTAVPYERSHRPSGVSGYGFAGRLKAAKRSVECLIECRCRWTGTH